MYDITVIGAGITGSFIARELSKYDLSILLLDKENDVANGTTKANSAIVHAGYDAVAGTLKAKFNVRGNEMYDEICKDLDVPFKRVGSLVTAFNDEEMKTIQDLYQRGITNGVPDMKILDKEEVLQMEDNLKDTIQGALYAKTAGIVGPWELAIALAENAVENGVELRLNSPVTAIQKVEDGYEITVGDEADQTDQTSETYETYKTKIVINCAGVYTDKINQMVNEKTFEILPNRGEYNLFDKSVGDMVSTVVFGCPSTAGKGIVILPTVHGNLLLGPTADYIDDKEDTRTTFEGLTSINDHAKDTLQQIGFQNVITSFSGIRAKVATKDFIIEKAGGKEDFINVAGIDSPGLTSAPAIAEYVVEMLRESVSTVGITLTENENFNGKRRPSIHFMDLSEQEQKKLIEKDPRFGRIICRCEYITEGEIVDVINRKAGATTLDGVKRRARPGSGRCQGGFCAPRVMEILARELDVDMKDVLKDGKGSYVLTKKTK